MKVTKVEIKDFSEMEFPPVVYKYRTWTDPNHKSIITNREVFFASPDSFVDPHDCKIPIRFDLLSPTEVMQRVRQDNPSWSRPRRRNYVKEWFSSHKYYVMKLQRETMNDFFMRFGVLSLTEIPDNESMWNRYSDNHKGFCVGFNSNVMFKFLGGGGPVVYYDSLPNIYPYPRHSYEIQYQLQIFSKLKEWEFEKEYRTHIFSGNSMLISNRKVQLPPEAYKEIILGKAMPSKIKEDLLKSIPTELEHIKSSIL